MSSGLGSLRCPFCIQTFISSSAPRTRKLRRCPYCKGKFFFYRGIYYISIKDIYKIKLEKNINQPVQLIKQQEKHS